MDKWREIIIGKLREQRVSDLSDPEIERAFSGCVASVKLIQTAKMLVHSHKITTEDIKQ